MLEGGETMEKDKEQLKLLSIFHYIVGGIMALISCFPLIYLALGIAMLSGAFEGENSPPKILGWVLILIPGIIIYCGWALAVCIILAGRKLVLFKNWTYCLVIACIECMFMPFGTVLGVFTIIVLMRESVKKLFEAEKSV